MMVGSRHADKFLFLASLVHHHVKYKKEKIAARGVAKEATWWPMFSGRGP